MKINKDILKRLNEFVEHTHMEILEKDIYRIMEELNLSKKEFKLYMKEIEKNNTKELIKSILPLASFVCIVILIVVLCNV